MYQKVLSKKDHFLCVEIHYISHQNMDNESLARRTKII